MMLIRLAFILIAIALVDCDDDKYTTKYDDTDVDAILASDRLLNGYAKCLLNEGPCSEDAKELKMVLKEALETDCAKCSDTQKTNAYKIMKYLIEKKKNLWARLEKLYDPDGTYRAKYEARLSTEKP